MSREHRMRRSDRLMSDEDALQMLATGFCGRLATVGVDAWPYVVPLLYVWMDQQVFIHRTSSGGHLAENLRTNSRVCFEIDAPGGVFAYGRYECDTGVAYASVIAFCSMRIVKDLEKKTRFCIELMRKYADAGWDRPQGFFPRIGEIDVYGMTIERLTGKQQVLPPISERWPALDRTRTPNAKPPASHEGQG